MSIKKVRLPHEVISDIVIAELDDQLTYHLSVVEGTSDYPTDPRDVRESRLLAAALLLVLQEYE
jgi:hypothetical protein